MKLLSLALRTTTVIKIYNYKNKTRTKHKCILEHPYPTTILLAHSYDTVTSIPSPTSCVAEGCDFRKRLGGMGSVLLGSGTTCCQLQERQALLWVGSGCINICWIYFIMWSHHVPLDTHGATKSIVTLSDKQGHIVFLVVFLQHQRCL